jgi:hypothetical protein
MVNTSGTELGDLSQNFDIPSFPADGILGNSNTLVARLIGKLLSVLRGAY